MGWLKNKLKKVGRAIDPTTTSGLLNLSTGGLYSQYEEVNRLGNKIDDKLSGKDQRDAIRDAAAKAETGQEAAILQQQQWMDYLMGVQKPYIDAGAQFLPQLTEFLDPDVQDAYRQQSLSSDGYRAISNAASENLISNASALGNRLSSGIQAEVLGEQGLLAQSYADNAVRNRLNQLQAGANLGLGALGVTGGQIGHSVSGIGQAYSNIGNIGMQSQMALGQYSGLTPYLNLATAGLGAYSAYNRV